MRGIVNSLLFRIAMLFLLGLVALQAAILLAAMWPDGRPLMFRLVDPADAREIAEAVERAPPELRPLIVAAASNSATTVELLPGFPESPAPEAGIRPAPRLEARFRRYADELGGRSIEVQVREGSVFSYGVEPDEPPRGPIRLLVRLSSGEVLAIERAPIVLQLLASRYIAVALVVAAILVVLMLTLLWQVVRPIGRLARATDAFREDMDAPDAAMEGAREVRALAGAFNGMKQRIGGLIAERTRMLAAIAHDLRTYLTRLRLRADHIADERQRDRAINDLEEMGRLLDDILIFSQTETGIETNPPVTDARAEALDYVETRRETGDEIGIAAGDVPLPCRCAPLAFRRMLANLIDNALRYGARPRVALHAEEGMVVVKVTDEGPGIPPALAERLTAPFERLEASRGRHSGGAGLGLSIVKALAESHGGSLTLENRTTGGLRAIVRLPGADIG